MDFLRQFGLTDLDLLNLTAIAVALLVLLGLLRTVFRLTRSILRMGCAILVFGAAILFLISLYGSG